MLIGRISLQGAHFELLEAEGDKAVDSVPTGEKIPLTILRITDAHTPSFSLDVPFTHDEFEKFATAMQKGTSSVIVHADRTSVVQISSANERHSD